MRELLEAVLALGAVGTFWMRSISSLSTARFVCTAHASGST
jgi:hypothetical protein